jgi:hypothetical protein
MWREALRLSSRQQRWFYGAFAVLFATGAGWMVLHWWPTNGDADLGPSPAEPWLMKIHGAAAMVALVVLGALIPLHIRRGWRVGVNRFTGMVMIGTMGLLALTGYGLYYAGGEKLRDIVVLIHEVVGIGLPLAIVWHIVRGRNVRSRKP